MQCITKLHWFEKRGSKNFENEKGCIGVWQLLHHHKELLVWYINMYCQLCAQDEEKETYLEVWPISKWRVPQIRLQRDICCVGEYCEGILEEINPSPEGSLQNCMCLQHVIGVFHTRTIVRYYCIKDRLMLLEVIPSWLSIRSNHLFLCNVGTITKPPLPKLKQFSTCARPNMPIITKTKVGTWE